MVRDIPSPSLSFFTLYLADDNDALLVSECINREAKLGLERTGASWRVLASSGYFSNFLLKKASIFSSNC
jgi:hypothetical protein